MIPNYIRTEKEMRNYILEQYNYIINKYNNILKITQSCWISAGLYVRLNYEPEYKIDFLILALGERNTIHIHEDHLVFFHDSKQTKIDFYETEEEYFQASLIYDLSCFDLNCFNECRKLYEMAINKVELK